MALALLLPVSASAQIESLVMPGKLIAGHAEYESDCGNCHKNFDREGQRQLCLDCHEDVAADIQGAMGFHGKDRSASDQACASCHTDHEGRDANIISLDETRFDHALTDFELIGKHSQASCDGCHEPGTKHRETSSACVDCHRDDDVHEDTMADTCGDCHTPTGWKDVEFDHDTTDFPLIGKHLEPACGDCHADQTFKDTPTTCFGCHAEDDAHEGRSGEQCETCHSPTGWEDTLFDHARDTEFELLGKHVTLECSECHSEDPFADSLDTGCVSCHREDDDHEGHHGDECNRCHSNDAWDVVHFNHEVDTGHALIGAHEEVECKACHIQPIFDVALVATCFACHEKDDAHKGSQGNECSDCHNENEWKENVFFDHDLTRFPLLGKHAEAECSDCHESHVFSDAPEQCIDCHRDDDSHEGRFSDNCSRCHNPVDWKKWQFDHGAQTEFPLDGAHASVKCESCHRQSLTSQARLGQQCADCHRNDDIHDGEFGPNCERCHSPDSFKEARSVR